MVFLVSSPMYWCFHSNKYSTTRNAKGFSPWAVHRLQCLFVICTCTLCIFLSAVLFCLLSSSMHGLTNGRIHVWAYVSHYYSVSVYFILLCDLWCFRIFLRFHVFLSSCIPFPMQRWLQTANKWTLTLILCLSPSKQTNHISSLSVESVGVRGDTRRKFATYCLTAD